MTLLKVAGLIILTSCGAVVLAVLWDALCWHFARDHFRRLWRWWEHGVMSDYKEVNLSWSDETTEDGAHRLPLTALVCQQCGAMVWPRMRAVHDHHHDLTGFAL